MNELLYLLLSFGVIIGFIRLKVNIGVSIFLGSLLLGVLFGLRPVELLRSFYVSSTEWSTIRLILIIALIMALTSILSQIGYLKMMEQATKELFPNEKYSLAALPALIGLMPMPAGALVSAPMIETVADKFNLPPEKKTITNYWFRHMWEHSWPMYQAIIIASAILSISVKEFSSKMFPLTVLMAIVGYLFFLKPIKSQDNERGNIKDGLKLFLKSTYPIIVIILISIVLGYDMVYGAFVGFLSALIPHFKKIDKKEVLKYALQPKIIFLLISVMYFKKLLEVTGAVEALPATILELNLPIVLVITLTPFLVGLITGISFAYVGMTFPLLAPFFTGFDKIALAYLSGYMGMLFSPVHLCLVFSAEYYKADLGKVYKTMLIPGFVFFILGVLYVSFL
ncbi:TIGR00529 family membrane protein [Thermococcus aggregans]|uniref:TIGR00529 family membrane protein n=1 Tax=Thermococcus aggregans TaxID=110163 RepID=A0A9E7MWU7_THEAG|nr:TIGR00529 family membrane protein [Thermococcus aggregans]USS40249.1 TIGR00529 family membrane protein [Thermococcus aggregans]